MIGCCERCSEGMANQGTIKDILQTLHQITLTMNIHRLCKYSSITTWTVGSIGVLQISMIHVTHAVAQLEKVSE